MTGRRRLRVCVRGVVQGVGFRPFVYTTAAALGLSGSVRNDSSGAIIEVEGDERDIATFLHGCGTGRRPLAVIESIETQDIPLVGGTGFRDRRHVAIGRWPHTGLPRRRHVRRLRGRTTRPRRPALPARLRQLHQLRPPVHHHRRHSPTTAPPPRWPRFAMCADCAREYADPGDRRFHAQPVCCPDCGPTLTLSRPRRPTADGEDGLRRAPGSCCATAGSSPSRASAATTWPATRATTQPWPNCVDESGAATSRSR